MEEIVLGRGDDAEPVVIQRSGRAVKALVQILEVLQRRVGLMVGGVVVVGGQLVVVVVVMHGAVVETVGGIRMVRHRGRSGGRGSR
jgi:hypothetical protein